MNIRQRWIGAPSAALLLTVASRQMAQIFSHESASMFEHIRRFHMWQLLIVKHRVTSNCGLLLATITDFRARFNVIWSKERRY